MAKRNVFSRKKFKAILSVLSYLAYDRLNLVSVARAESFSSNPSIARPSNSQGRKIPGSITRTGSIPTPDVGNPSGENLTVSPKIPDNPKQCSVISERGIFSRARPKEKTSKIPSRSKSRGPTAETVIETAVQKRVIYTDRDIRTMMTPENLARNSDQMFNEQLKVPSFIKDPLLKLSGGSNELNNNEEALLVESVLAKTEQTEIREISLNKFLKKIAKWIESIISNQKFWTIVKQSQTPVEPKVDNSLVPSTEILGSAKAESENSSVFADAFVIRDARKRSSSNLPLKNDKLSTAQTKSQTLLEGRRRNRIEINIDMDSQYQ